MLPAALIWFLLAAQDTPNAPVLSLSPPAVPARIGARIPVGTYFRNAGNAQLRLVPPLQFDAQLVTTHSRMHVALSRTGEWSSDRTIAPGDSLFVVYELELPQGVSGRAVLELQHVSAAPVVIDIERDAASTAQVGENPDSPGDPYAVSPAPGGFRYADTSIQRFHAYEPMYFLAGTTRPNVRFQFSFQYQIFNPEGPWASHTPFLAGLFLGYTQTGLWDLEGSSLPFTDANYKPEIAWSSDQVDWLKIPGVDQVGLQSGIQHESNGEDGDESRSINTVYLRPVLHFGDPKGFSTQVAPKFYLYFSEQENNEDIEEYRGYCDLKVTAGWAAGLQATALGRLGSGGEHGSIQLDLTYPLRQIGKGNIDMYLQLQWFSGYGESLITYDEHTDALRLGLGFVR